LTARPRARSIPLSLGAAAGARGGRPSALFLGSIGGSGVGAGPDSQWDGDKQ